ncbi:TolC family protein [Chitinophaga sp.]|uniref:TolC family protein n=1 Tax=Chitinophaga sp. TaxID=1869181 RepID=UPI0031D2C30A
MYLKRVLFLFLYLAVITSVAQAQMDTVRYTLADAEKIFLENNLSLLAGKLEIPIAEAKILQAKAWPNPNLTIDNIQLYTNGTTEATPPLFGNFWRDRTFAAQLEQLVYTARKRKKNIDLESRNKDFAAGNFLDLLQSLKADFRQTEASLLYLQQIQGDQLVQIGVVNTLLKAQQAMLKQGNISQTEMYRIKALQISLQSDINATHEDLTAQQEHLKNLLALNPTVYLVLEDPTPTAEMVSELQQHPLQELLTQATQHNAGIMAAQQQKAVNVAALTVEKANAVPDLTLNANYERAGNVQNNFMGVGVSMDLPFFNRNKGNIKAAQLAVQQSDLLEKNKITEVNNAVVKEWTDLHKAIGLYESIDTDYLDKLDTMVEGISRNFVNRNMSLLEFLDFFSSFRDSKQQYYAAIKNISIKKATLNYLTGTEL